MENEALDGVFEGALTRLREMKADEAVHLVEGLKGQCVILVQRLAEKDGSVSRILVSIRSQVVELERFRCIDGRVGEVIEAVSQVLRVPVEDDDAATPSGKKRMSTSTRASLTQRLTAADSQEIPREGAPVGGRSYKGKVYRYPRHLVDTRALHVSVAEHLKTYESFMVAIMVSRHGTDGQKRLFRLKHSAAMRLMELASERESCPNIVPILECKRGGGDQSNFMIRMETCEAGGSLEERLSERMSSAEVLKIVIHLSRGLAFAHERGIIHSNLKPSNVLLRSVGDEIVPALSDFLDRREGEDCRVRFNAPYSAPEGITEGVLTEKSDVYSLGMVLLHLIGTESLRQGSFPPVFHGFYRPWRELRFGIGDWKAALKRRVRIRDLGKAIADEVSVFLSRMVAEDPKERPTAKVVEEKMLEFLGYLS